jgi:hypothetical protein
MAVCRRCGTATDGPAGRSHQPGESQVARIVQWLDDQDRRNRIAAAVSRRS